MAPSASTAAARTCIWEGGGDVRLYGAEREHGGGGHLHGGGDVRLYGAEREHGGGAHLDRLVVQQGLQRASTAALTQHRGGGGGVAGGELAEAQAAP